MRSYVFFSEPHLLTRSGTAIKDKTVHVRLSAANQFWTNMHLKATRWWVTNWTNFDSS